MSIKTEDLLDAFYKSGSVGLTVGGAPDNGFLVSVRSFNFESENDAASLAATLYNTLVSNPNVEYGRVYIGLFKLASGLVSVDMNIRVEGCAKRFAMHLGKVLNQESIWDCNRQECIPTGGTGRPSLQTINQGELILQWVLASRAPVRIAAAQVTPLEA